ncbi:RNA binding (RRM/RBD/RNP motif) family protein [Abeliophyllum distichum]|uniref:RNA binding (RRM/RBD/RNP motif) family protein n=1 Tax=Abeliophyllum distichum TaxID=126358 RepID=A0ABD1TFV6_9LAMI
MEGNDRTFRVSFTSEGVVKLRERVQEKLKEFMGDYTDDTLVDYVIVLLKNGRSKGEAKNELNVFLGDDSDFFVSWLWDHLGSNLDLYVQPLESHPDEVPKTKSASGEQTGRNDSHQIESGAEKVNSNRTSRNRHSRELKGLVGDEDEVSPPQTSVVARVNAEDESHHKVGRAKGSLSPRPVIQKKRIRREEGQTHKREAPQASINASRRLLQFAVRDAVAISGPSNSTTEPSLKRLRSVVSTSAADSCLEEHHKRIRSVARVHTVGMSVAIKAVEEAVKDVKKLRSSGSVFDRLGRATDVLDSSDHLAKYREDIGEDVGRGALGNAKEDIQSTYYQRNECGGQHDGGSVSLFQGDAVMDSGLLHDAKSYDGVNVIGRGVMGQSRSGTSGGNRGEDSVMHRYGVADDVQIVLRPRKDQDEPAYMADTSHKIVSTWKLPQYQEAREVLEMNNGKLIQESETGATKLGERLLKENANPIVAVNGNVKPDVDLQGESLKTQTLTSGLHSIALPTEDADSRTLFISNVHFAATKDSLSRHFNKFGEVLKVIIPTDATTGQPKGSAYIEFMRKEAAEHALTLDGTSFMSRLLKIVKKSSAKAEVASVVTWPRVARTMPYTVSRFGRVPFGRGIPSVYRARPPIKPGARSFQWKRDAQSTPTDISGQATNSFIPSPTARSLTYVRTEPKRNGSSSTD